MLKYTVPENWIKYDPVSIVANLVNAKAAVLSLKSMPYHKSWVENLQKMELKREVAGTAKIEGADFTDSELDAALKETPEELHTRSQRQARAAKKAYLWIADIPDDRPIDEKLICEIHNRMVTGADDDHCPPGIIRAQDQNVTFGTPRHRGVEGGSDCAGAFAQYVKALQQEYSGHDPFVQALAAHFHFASMHPFLDGNGRTARCLEALLLKRAGLRDTCFIAMSNYYYDEKIRYLGVLSESRAQDFNLTSFLNFGLRGIETQSKRLLSLIRQEVSRELFLSLALKLFKRLKSRKKRVIAGRQLEILKILLANDDGQEVNETFEQIKSHYGGLKSSWKAFVRDAIGLHDLGAIKIEESPDKQVILKVDLDWPTKITETDFYKIISELPKAKTHSFLK